MADNINKMLKENYIRIAIINTSISHYVSESNPVKLIKLAFKPNRILVHFVKCEGANKFADSNTPSSYAQCIEGGTNVRLEIVSFSQERIEFRNLGDTHYQGLDLEIIAIE